MKPTLKVPESKRLKLKCDKLRSSFAFNFNLRRYITDTDAFVGHFLSNLSRLAVEMMAAKKGYLPPYVSMDGPWQGGS